MYRVPGADDMPGGRTANARSPDWSGRSDSVSGIAGTSAEPTMRPALGGPSSRSTYGAAYTSPGRSVGTAVCVCAWAGNATRVSGGRVARSSSVRVNTVCPSVGPDTGLAESSTVTGDPVSDGAAATVRVSGD